MVNHSKSRVNILASVWNTWEQLQTRATSISMFNFKISLSFCLTNLSWKDGHQVEYPRKVFEKSLKSSWKVAIGRLKVLRVRSIQSVTALQWACRGRIPATWVTYNISLRAKSLYCAFIKKFVRSNYTIAREVSREILHDFLWCGRTAARSSEYSRRMGKQRRY